MPIKNIFLTGPPSVGKTTVIKKVVAGLSRAATGFYTEELRTGDKRSGFLMKTLDGKEGLLGHEAIKSQCCIRRYGVSIENIESIAVPAITPCSAGEVIIIDEIGKMECFSQAFREAALKALNSANTVVGTIAVGGTDFIREIKERKDMKILDVTPLNRDTLPRLLLDELEIVYTHGHDHV
jgi:nucleoside-triphosphatase